MEIKQNMCPESKYDVKCPYSMNPIGVCIHNTANDASAANEVAYMLNNSNKVSYHYAVDDSEIIQAIPNNRNAWHAGDGNGDGNRKYISIEICYSKSGGARFETAMKNAAWLTAKLLKDYGWDISRVKKHQDFSGKYCPHRILDDYGWDYFLNLVNAELGIEEGSTNTAITNTKEETQAERIVSEAKARLGSPDYYYGGQNYCQQFVKEVYAAVFGNAAMVSYGSATGAWQACGRSVDKNNIPLAAAVYFNGSDPKYGHVGIYIGNGEYIHAYHKKGAAKGTVGISKLANVEGWRGWGFHANLVPDGAFSYTSAGSSEPPAGDTETEESAPQKVDITKVVVKSSVGNSGAHKFEGIRDAAGRLNTGVEILIQNDKIYAPSVVGTASLVWERKNSPGSLTFEVVKDDVLNFQEGNPVSFCYNGQKAFYGYVFKKERTDNRTIRVTCYDQLRYFKNKDTISYTDKTYTQLVQMLADDHGLVCGSLDNTEYVIKSRIEEGTLFDICGNASDLTLDNTNRLFVLYDDFGELTLTDINNMALSFVIHESNAEKFTYSTSIDDNVYNRVKLTIDNDKTGEREVYISQDEENQRNWGVLQYYENLSDSTGEQAKLEADTRLRYYNKKRRSLTVRGCEGRIYVRGGSVIPVNLSLGDIDVNEFMLVEKVTHRFEKNCHTMDLNLSGIGSDFTV